jgi:hypothetical protein
MPADSRDSDRLVSDVILRSRTILCRSEDRRAPFVILRSEATKNLASACKNVTSAASERRRRPERSLRSFTLCKLAARSFVASLLRMTAGRCVPYDGTHERLDRRLTMPISEIPGKPLLALVAQSSGGIMASMVVDPRHKRLVAAGPIAAA